MKQSLAEHKPDVVRSMIEAVMMTALDVNGERWNIGDEFYTTHSPRDGEIRFNVVELSWEDFEKRRANR